MERAVKPLVSEAKQALRAEAVPILSEINFILSVERRSCESSDSWGPETGMEGLFQVKGSPVVDALAESRLSLDLSFSPNGGKPIMPPSRSLIVMGGIGGLSEPESCC